MLNEGSADGNQTPKEDEHIATDRQSGEYIKAYTSSEVAQTLGVSTSTLRRYSIALETSGYVIIRNDKDQRVYVQDDINVLKKQQELIDAGIAVTKAADMVCKQENISKDVTGASTSAPALVPEELIKQIEQMSEQFISKQEENNMKLIEEIERDRELVIGEIKKDRELAERNAKVVTQQLDAMKAMNYRLMEKLEAKEEAETMDKNVEKSVDKKKNLFLRLFNRD